MIKTPTAEHAKFWFLRTIAIWYIFLFVQPFFYKTLGKNELMISLVTMIVLIWPLVMVYLFRYSWPKFSVAKRALAVVGLIQPIVTCVSVILAFGAGALISASGV